MKETTAIIKPEFVNDEFNIALSFTLGFREINLFTSMLMINV